MVVVRIGLVADPAAPTRIAQHLHDVAPEEGRDEWEVSVVSEPFTTGSEDAQVACDRLDEHRRRQGWDVVVGLTELPLYDAEGRHLLVEVDASQRVAVLSLPALGALRMHFRARRALQTLVSTMTDPDEGGERTVVVPRARGHWRLLTGMVMANRPWRLVPGLRSALGVALATGAVAAVYSTVWLLAIALPWWRLAVVTVASIAFVVAWLVLDSRLWDRPDDDSPQARRRCRLYNASTLLSLTIGVSVSYVGLYVINLVWILFVLDPTLVGSFLRMPVEQGDLFALPWLVASAAIVGGGLGSHLESDEAVWSAAYSKREEGRRSRLARERSSAGGRGGT